MKQLAIIALLLLLPSIAVAQGISQLQQFTSTTTPSSAITQTSYGKAVKLTGLTAGQCLKLDSNNLVSTVACSAGGTVTSVGLSVPSFLSVSGSPVTTNGTLAVTLSGTALPVANGGTGTTAIQKTLLFAGDPSGTYLTQVATSSLGLLTTNVAEGSNLYFTNARAQSALSGLYEVPLSFTWPLIRTTNTLSFGGLSTSSAAVVGNIPYFSGVNTFANVATGTASCSTGASCNSFTVIGSSPTITTTLGTSVDLTSEITGRLPFSNLTQGAANTILANVTGGTADFAALATSSLFAGTAGQAAYFSGTGALVGTSSLFITTAGKIGIGTTTPPTKLTIQPAAYSTATDGIEFTSSDNTTHSIIQPIKIAGGAMNVFIGANSYVDTAGTVQRFNASAASAFINFRSSDGAVQFATNGTGAAATPRFLIDASGNAAFVSLAAATANRLCYDTTTIAGANTLSTCAGPAFSANKGGTDQTGIGNNVVTLLTWSTEDFDTNNNFASNKFTPTVAGKYLVTLSTYCSNQTSYCDSIIEKNGTIIAVNEQGTASGVRPTVQALTVVSMNGSTDYLEAYTSMDNGGSGTVNGLARLTSFTGVWIAP